MSEARYYAVLATHALGGLLFSYDRSIHQHHFVYRTAQRTVCGVSAIDPKSYEAIPNANSICIDCWHTLTTTTTQDEPK